MQIRVTICHLTLYEKPQKLAFFRPSDPFVRAEPLHLGSKFEYFLTNPGISNPLRLKDIADKI